MQELVVCGVVLSSNLYIFDQNLKNFIGHYFEYDRSVAEGAIRRGFKCTVLAHQDADLPEGLKFEIQSVYSKDIWNTLPGANFHDTPSIEAMGDLFAEETLAALKENMPGKGDVVFFPTITKNQMPGVAKLAEKFAKAGASIKVMLRYQKALMDGEAADASYKRLEALVAQGLKVTLCADSHRLGADLGTLTSLPIETYPIPHTDHADDDELLDKAGNSRRDRTLRLVSLGNARGEKGMAEILEAVRLTEKEPWARKLRFHLQVNDPSEDVVDAIESYKRRPDPRVTLIDEVMSSEKYSDLLKSADVILTPYHRDIYRERTSGVFLEGITAGKVVIGTEDTWMGDLLAIHRGGIAARDRDAQSIADALHSIVHHFEAYQDRADVAAKIFRKSHTAENLVNHLLDDGVITVPLASPRKAAIIYPWGDGATGRSGAGLRLRLLTQYLERFYSDVRILFTAQGEQGGMLTDRTHAEPYYYTQNERTRALYDRLVRFAPKVGGTAADVYHLWHHTWPKDDAEFRTQCEGLVDWADDVFLEYSYFTPVVSPLCADKGKRLFVTQHDVVSDQVEDSPLLRNATAKLEMTALREAPRVIAATAGDQRDFGRAGIESDVIPHPIDLASLVAFEQAEAARILEEMYDIPIRGRKLCFFVGSAYEMNAQAAVAVRDMARRYDGMDCLFAVAGKCMEPVEDGNFIALGRVDDAALCALYGAADIVLVPLLKGTGSSIKSIEALAYGCPILSTSVGMRGIPVESGVQCVIEDDLSAYPALIAEMLADDAQQKAFRETAREFGAGFHYEKVFKDYGVAELGADEEPQPMGMEENRRRIYAELLGRALLKGDDKKIKAYRHEAGIYAQAVLDAHRNAQQAQEAAAAATRAPAVAEAEPEQPQVQPPEAPVPTDTSAPAPAAVHEDPLSHAGPRPSFARRVGKTVLLLIPQVRHIYQQLLIANKRVETLGKENQFIRNLATTTSQTQQKLNSVSSGAERLERKFDDHQAAMTQFANQVANLAAENSARTQQNERRLDEMYTKIDQVIEKVEDVDTALRIVEHNLESIAGVQDMLSGLSDKVDRWFESAEDRHRQVAERLSDHLETANAKHAMQSERLSAALAEVCATFADYKSGLQKDLLGFQKETTEASRGLAARIASVETAFTDSTSPEPTDEDRFELLHAQSDRGIFVLGSPRSATTITANLINANSHAFLLSEANIHIEERRRLAGEGAGFRQRYNSRHIENLNQRSKSSYLPDLLGHDEADWPDQINALADNYDHFGEKLALTTYHFGEVSPEETMRFFERHFFRSRYIFTMRNPRDSLGSMTKLFNVSDTRTLLYYAIAWVSMMRMWSEWVRVFPHTLTLQCDEFDESHAQRIAEFTGLKIDPDLIDQSRRKTYRKLPAPCEELMEQYGADLDSIYDLAALAIASPKLWQKEYKRVSMSTLGSRKKKADLGNEAESIGLVWLEASRIIEKMEKDLQAEAAGA